jgi:ribosomal protein S18 acetylase RimI-like enzyme
MAAVHVAAFPSSALTRLGREAVRRYYQWQLEGPHDAVSLGVFVDHQLAGFLVGGVFQGAMAGFVRANRLFLLSRLVTHPWLAMNPVVRDRARVAVRTLVKQRRVARSAAPAKAKAPRPFGVLAVAIQPERQGLGLGARLMREAEARALSRGFGEMELTVDPDNSRGIAFYHHLEWHKVSAGGAWHGLMVKRLERQ